MLTLRDIVRSLLFIFFIATPIVIWSYLRNANNLGVDDYVAGAQLRSDILFRMKVISNYLFNEFTNSSRYGILFLPAFLLFVFQSTVLLIHKKNQYLLPAVLLLLQFASYVVIYSVTSIPIEWQVKNSIERLLLHLLPAFYIVVAYHLAPIFELQRRPR